jgi:hypothetical protein
MLSLTEIKKQKIGLVSNADFYSINTVILICFHGGKSADIRAQNLRCEPSQKVY